MTKQLSIAEILTLGAVLEYAESLDYDLFMRLEQRAQSVNDQIDAFAAWADVENRADSEATKVKFEDAFDEILDDILGE